MIVEKKLPKKENCIAKIYFSSYIFLKILFYILANTANGT
jgi:hypothetical protein